jgi:hypothetical protein
VRTAEVLGTSSRRLCPLGGLVKRDALPMRTEHREHPRLAWRTRAACRHYPQLDWIEPSPLDAGECRSVCGGCPVRVECLEFALESREPWGIWGSLDTDERREVARVRAVAAPRVLPAHGTNPRYAKHRCRCDPCRSAHAEYERDRRQRRKRSPAPVPTRLTP